MLNIAVNERKWRLAYRLWSALALLFFLFAIIMHLLVVEQNLISALGSAAYFVGTIFIFLLMVTSGGALAPVAWYVLGSGIFFGLGSSLWGFIPDIYGRGDLQAMPGDLLDINLLNSGSIIVVLLAASLPLGRRVSRVSTIISTQLNVNYLYRVLAILVMATILVDYYFFPVAQDLVLRSFQAKAKYVTWMFLLTSGVFWPRLNRYWRTYAIIVTVLVVFRGVLAFSKTEMLYPVLCFLAGYWTTNRKSIKVILPMAVLLVVFSLALVPLVKQGRTAGGYDALSNNVYDRISMLIENTQTRVVQDSSEHVLRPLARVAHGPYQAYLIEQYQMGNAGNTLQDFWVAVIPRALWPNKPDISRFGVQLHEQFNRVIGASSALAPTYSAEAYWNYGIFGLIVVSALIGLQFGWLSKCWFKSIQGGNPSYLVIAFPAAFFALNVESWILISYLGGFVTLLVIWFGARLLMQAMSKRASTDQHLYERQNSF